MLYNKKQTQYMSGALTQNEGKLTSYVQQGIGGGGWGPEGFYAFDRILKHSITLPKQEGKVSSLERSAGFSGTDAPRLCS